MTLLITETNVSIFIENFLAAILDTQNGHHQIAIFAHYSATKWDMVMNLVAIPTFLGSREMVVQSKILLADGHLQIQDGCHRDHSANIGSIMELYT